MSAVTSFLRRNIVFLVTIPSVVVIHYGWYKLQQNEDFIPQDIKNKKILGISLDTNKLQTEDKK